MKDGYYLSTYLYINKLMYLYKGRLRHDQNIALWLKEGQNVKLVHYWELERITGLKMHDKAFYDREHAKKVINILLARYNLTIDDMVEIWGTPELDSVDDYLSIDEYPDYAYHNICHIFSALLMDTSKFYNEDFICLAVDGGPDEVIDKDAQKKFAFTGCVSRKGEITFFPISSPGALWFMSSYYFNYREGTLMALANATKCKVDKEIKLNMPIRNFSDMVALNEWYKKILNMEGDESEIQYCDNGMMRGKDEKFSDRDNYISAVMKEIQKISTNMMVDTVSEIIEKYHLDSAKTNLALAGGFALNCPTNTRLMNQFHFRTLMAPPCVNDGGISLGVGLFAFHKKNSGFQFAFQNSYYGDDDAEAIDKLHILKNDGFIESIQKFNEDVFFEDISNGPVIWFDGRAEIGPRSLGNRSILGDPRKQETKDFLNKVKRRQWWRPVAPIVLSEHVQEWFDADIPSPYMLNTFYIRSEKTELIPAVVHIDKSARIQTLEKKDNHLLYKAIHSFYQKTGIPMLCNTSLNDKGEPIVNKIEEAYNFALRKYVEIMYINGFRVQLKNFSNYKEKNPDKRKKEMMKYLTLNQEKEMRKLVNPYNLSDKEIMVYTRLPELYDFYNIQKKDDVEKLRIIIGKLISNNIINFKAIEAGWYVK